jgi:hypothetical protein
LVITYWAGSLWRASSDLRWQKYSAPAPDKDIVRFIPTNHPDKFFAIVGEFSSDEGALFWTDTGGASWQKVNDKVPYSCPFHSCNGFASTDGRVLILGSILLPLIVESGKSGGYISRDGGKTWNSLLRNQLENELKSLEPTARRQMPIKETPDQIDAAMRGIKAEEIRTQEEFERARKR